MKISWCTPDKITCYITSVLLALSIVAAVVMITTIKSSSGLPAWSYECRSNLCVKVELDAANLNNAISLPVCRMFCGQEIGVLWPKPSGPSSLDSIMVQINREKIDIRKPTGRVFDSLWGDIETRFYRLIDAKTVHNSTLKAGGQSLMVRVTVAEPDNPNLESYTNESYKLSISQDQNKDVLIDIDAHTVFGARHALETLSQLIIYDEIRNDLQISIKAEIIDAPKYKHRGLSLDTSRNYYSVDAIKRTIDAMAMTKLNVFHWHITDSHSFPLVLKSHPDLTKYGAYTPRKIYTADAIRDIVSYGRIRGVRVIPEFDQPAHVGEGWQRKDMTACFNAQPWELFCVEPPCGQLDPTVDKVYDVLEDIYREMYDYFGRPDIFHLGGDEVSFGCWNASTRIQNWMTERGWTLDEPGYMKLWGYFQDHVLDRFDKVVGEGRKLPVIMWTSHLTAKPYVDQYLDKSRYIIQIWTTGDDTQIQDLLESGYKLILSNYDALYMDCGFGGWVNDGNNWCSPYIGWHKVYENRPDKIAGKYLDQILGGEAALWSEQADDHTIDSRYWPRASAWAERLWSDPETSWRDADSRMLIHRERLVENGIAAESIQPEWCLQNEGDCPISTLKNRN